jgi:hypothetical protein
MTNTPSMDVMYNDMIREKGALGLYGAILNGSTALDSRNHLDLV